MIIENISPYLTSSIIINLEKIEMEPLSILEINSEDGTQSIKFQNKEYIIPLSEKNPIKLDPENSDIYFLNQPLPPLKNKVNKVEKIRNIHKDKSNSNYWLIIILIIITIIVIFIIIKKK